MNGAGSARQRTRPIVHRLRLFPSLALLCLAGCGGNGFSIDDAALCSVPQTLEVDGPAAAAIKVREDIDFGNLQARALREDAREVERLAAAYMDQSSPSREASLVAAVGALEEKCDAR